MTHLDRLEPLNLARRPFTNARPVTRAAVLLWLLGLLLLLGNIALFRSYLSNSAEKRAELSRLEMQILKESRLVSQLEAQLANTNLEQISDWLTKILVGVGLTQVRQISAKLYELSGGVAWGLSRTHGNNHTFALSLILFYLIVGFLFAYLWTRLYLPGAFQKSESALNSLRAKVEEVDRRSKDAEANSTGTGKGEIEEAQKQLLEITEGIAPGNPNDPWKGVFGGQNISNDRQLQAEVKPIPGSAGLFAIRLKVSSLHAQTNQLKGAVQFFLHPTFTNDKPVVTVGPNGTAELNTKAWGAFTVGALADDGQTKLELDLSQLSTAPPEFRSR